MRNYYGSLCAEMYDILHEKAPQDELRFYLSYAAQGQRILEPLCGSGRFLIPFMERGYDITGFDLSRDMLAKLRQKAPSARAVESDIASYHPSGKFDYLFIPSGSLSLFTDNAEVRDILFRMKGLLAPQGVFVFAVDTVSVACENDNEYRSSAIVRTDAGLTLTLKTKNFYDERSQTQFSPGIYELRDDSKILQSESVDFQTHLYRFGEMERILAEVGFSDVNTYSSFDKRPAIDDNCEAFLFECRV